MLVSHGKRLAVFGLIATLLVGAVAPGQGVGAATPEEELQRLERERAQTARELEQIQARKSATTRRFRILNEELRQAEGHLYQLNAELGDLEGRLGKTQQEIEQTSAQLTQAQQQLDRRQRLLDTRVRVMYELGTVSYLSVLFSATSFSDFVSRFELLKSIIQGDVELFQQVTQIRNEIAEKKRTLEQRRAELAGIKEQTESKRRDVQQVRLQVEAKKEATRQDLELIEQQEDRLQQISEALVSRIAQLQAQQRRKRNGGKIQMDWPVRGPITSPFGLRLHPILNKYKGHNGMDIGVPSGTPIKAAESGVVIHSGWIEGYGYTTIIDHGDGVSTLYAHSSKLLTRVNQSVAQGETVALVGSTGWSTGPHLHFEVRVNGQPQDPANWLP